MTLDTQYHYKSFHQTVVNTYIFQILKVSLKLQAFLHVPNKKRKSACAVHRQAGYTAPWRINRTLPVPARAQLRTFFSNVWRDRQGAGQ